MNSGTSNANNFLDTNANPKIKNFISWIKKVIEWFNNLDSWLLIFIILCLSFLGFILHPNEESYYPLAKQFMNPGWMPHSFNFNEWPGNRFLFQVITGFALKFISFEQLAFWGRLVMFLLLSIPVAKVLKLYKLSNVGIFILMVLYFDHQNHFGGEFIFGDFEVKTIAFVFLFYSLYYLLQNKYYLSCIFGVIATYFHILVGGLLFPIFLLYILIESKNFWLTFKIGALYILCLIPQLVYIFSYLHSSGSVIKGINIDWVYVYVRLTHHASPLFVKGAITKTYPRIGLSILIFIICLIIHRSLKDQKLKRLNLLNILVFSYLYICLIISIFDYKCTLLKLHLFRPAALGSFITFLFIAYYFSQKYMRFAKYATIALGIGCLFVFTANSINTVKHLIHPPRDVNEVDMINYVKNNTKPDDVIAINIKYNSQDLLDFSRSSEREVFFITKLVPGGGYKIYEWYKRKVAMSMIYADLKYLDVVRAQYRIDYILSPKPLNNFRITEIYSNKGYYLYKINL